MSLTIWSLLYMVWKINCAQNGSQNFNVKCKAMPLLEDSIGENLDDFECDDDFLDTIPKA